MGYAFCMAQNISAQSSEVDSASSDSIVADSVVVDSVVTDSFVGFNLLNTAIDRFTEWNNTDSLWIMPQLYNFAVMVQSTTTFENFTIRSLGEDRQSLHFSPEPSFRLGGYFGWRWLFLGYNWDISGLLGNKNGIRKNKSLDLSFYTSKVGIDLYYRDTGNDFRCTNLDELLSKASPELEGISDVFDAIRLKTKGVNVYYIFNHRHYSHPAAFSQTTCQLRSCGTFKLGLSFTHHKVSLDNDKLDERLTPHLDPTLLFNTVKYNDYSINFGYAYNWVFAKNWLLCVDLAPGLAYNVTYYDADNIASGSVREEDTNFRHFSIDKLNLDFITRMALVYNNTRYFAGASWQFHSFDYRNRQISMNNSFGYLRVYVGMNFGRK